MTFEGTTEFGNPFMSRQSYLASEIKWCAVHPPVPGGGCSGVAECTNSSATAVHLCRRGYKFSEMIRVPKPGDSHYTVDITKWAALLRACFRLSLGRPHQSIT